MLRTKHYTIIRGRVNDPGNICSPIIPSVDLSLVDDSSNNGYVSPLFLFPDSHKDKLVVIYNFSHVLRLSKSPVT